MPRRDRDAPAAGTGRPHRLVALYRWAQDRLLPERWLVRRFITRTVPALDPRRGLDVGVGAAPFAAALCRAAPGLSLLGLDLFPRAGIDLVADAERLPLAAGTIDLLVCFQVLQYVPDPDRAVAEMMRTLRPHGHLLVTYPFLYGETHEADRWRWTEPGFVALLTRHGFEPVARARLGGPWFNACSAAAASLIALVPGHRRWQTPRSARGALTLAAITALALPFHLLGWAALLADALVGTPRHYVGGILLARRGLG